MSKLPQTIVYERENECELCGKEMNSNDFNIYRGREICSRCQEEIKK